VIDITNSKSKINFIEYQNAYLTGYEDVERRVPDINKIRKYTGWEPEIKLSATIIDVVESLLKNI
jgi:UDP-glucose 4-epimerase